MTEGCAFAHLDPAYRRFAALPDDERIAWIRADRWIGFDRSGVALARLENLLTYPPRDRMPCLLIYGDTGMGKTKIVRKFGEEAIEVCVAALSEGHDEVVAESSDLLYHLLVLWVDQDIKPDQVWAELESRFGTSGIVERESRTATPTPED